MVKEKERIIEHTTYDAARQRPHSTSTAQKAKDYFGKIASRSSTGNMERSTSNPVWPRSPPVSSTSGTASPRQQKHNIGRPHLQERRSRGDTMSLLEHGSAALFDFGSRPTDKDRQQSAKSEHSTSSRHSVLANFFGVDSPPVSHTPNKTPKFAPDTYHSICLEVNPRPPTPLNPRVQSPDEHAITTRKLEQLNEQIQGPALDRGLASRQAPTALNRLADSIGTSADIFDETRRILASKLHIHSNRDPAKKGKWKRRGSESSDESFWCQGEEQQPLAPPRLPQINFSRPTSSQLLKPPLPAKPIESWLDSADSADDENDRVPTRPSSAFYTSEMQLRTDRRLSGVGTDPWDGKAPAGCTICGKPVRGVRGLCASCEDLHNIYPASPYPPPTPLWSPQEVDLHFAEGEIKPTPPLKDFPQKSPRPRSQPLSPGLLYPMVYSPDAPPVPKINMRRKSSHVEGWRGPEDGKSGFEGWMSGQERGDRERAKELLERWSAAQGPAAEGSRSVGGGVKKRELYGIEDGVE